MGISDPTGTAVNDAAHLPIMVVSVQCELAASTLKVIVIMLDEESVSVGAKNPVWSTRRGAEVPSNIFEREKKNTICY